jgi:hypothetical protein
MTRACMDCGAILGEICPKCGGQLVGANGRYFHCMPCALPVVQGDGGTSHGLCKVCYILRRAELYGMNDGACA